MLSRLLSLAAPVAVLTFAPASNAVAQRTGYYREPALSAAGIVFASEGDLWIVGSEGGIASRLTTHPADETNPVVTTDGKTVAFVARYEGSADIYAMPTAGGRPRRLTYGVSDAVLSGFSPDGRLLYGSRTASTLPDNQLFALDLETSAAERLPLHQAWQGVVHEPSRTLIFTRIRHTQDAKRYQGGQAEQLWSFALDRDAEAVPLTGDHAGTSTNPMVFEDRIYFVTDRDGTRNIWSMTLAGKELKQHTQHVGWDVMEASQHGERIAYRVGADLYLLDVTGRETPRRLAISLRTDADLTRLRWDENPWNAVSDTALSADGSMVAMIARGQAFVAPADRKGPVVTVSRRAGVRYREATFVPSRDDEPASLAVLSDESGEVEVWTMPAATGGTAAGRKQWTDARAALPSGLVASPGGRYLTWRDKDGRLLLLDRNDESNSIQTLDSDPDGIRSLVWSADERWLAYVKPSSAQLDCIYVRDIAAGTTIRVTDPRYASYSPDFGRNGEWLYFLSDRNFSTTVGSPWGTFQPAPHFPNRTGIYMVALVDDATWPFDPHAAETEDDKDAKRSADAKDVDDETTTDETDTDKGGERVADDDAAPLSGDAPFGLYRVPVRFGEYRGVAATDNALWVIERQRSAPGKPSRTPLAKIEIGPKAKLKTAIENISGLSLSADRKKALVRVQQSLHVVPTKASSFDAKALAKAKVDLSGWRMRFEPLAEWRQIFDDAWRMHRDYFYDPGMHGVDWPAMQVKYGALVERIGSRAELNDLIGQMIAELAALHSSARGGDSRDAPESITVASLGARIVADAAAGGWRIEHVYGGDPELVDRRGPLSRPDHHIDSGDVIVAIDGQAFEPGLPISALLREKVGVPVRLSVRDGAPDGAGEPGSEPRDVVVEPISMRDAGSLRYDEWEWTRKQIVEQRGAGKLGYIHLRAMGSRDIATWVREYAPLFDRAGLVIDVRHNRGGNIDSWILNRLIRRAWFYWKSRGRDVTWNMHRAFRGHMVVLCDQHTASDGEAFAEGFQRLGLGPVIGMRTWGGEIWLSRSNRQVDGGVASAGMTGVFADGKWLIEGHGVVPDIEVDNLPHATFGGADAQLDRAIQHLLERIERDPRSIPTPPAFPDKSSPDNRRRDR